MLGDGRCLTLCEALLDDPSKPPASSLLQLKAQMNMLSASFATRLFRLLLSEESSKKPPAQRDDDTVEFAVAGEDRHRRQHLIELDLGFNPLLVNTDDGPPARRPGTSDAERQEFHAALRSLIGSKDHGCCCPTDLGLDCTGIEASTCRAIAKGIIQRFALISPAAAADDESTENPPSRHTSDALPPAPISLRMARNPGIGDPGVAALAAALRTVTRQRPGIVVLETLDVSDCDIGDTGAEALSMAFDTPAGRNAIRRLVIGHNRIGNRGLSALCRAFPPATLVLDGNDQITDSGMSAVADMISGAKKADASSIPTMSKLSLRSCSLKASGAERIGTALRSLVVGNLQREIGLEIDLSGNPFGMLRGKAKGDSKYSASRIKSTISATASAYMSQGMSILKKGFGSTIESDDEEEKRDGVESDDEDEDIDQDRCGLKALANAFLFGKGSDDMDENVQEQQVEGTPPRLLTLGLRRTFCDTAGAEALAAMLVEAKDRFHCDLKLDLGLNPVLEEDIVAALHGGNDELLHEMSDRHRDAMEILQQVKQRAALAARAAAARLRREDDLEAEWGSVGNIDDGDSYDFEDPYEENVL